MSSKVVYVMSDVKKSLSFEWIATSSLARDFELSFVLMNDTDSPLERFLIKKNIPVTRFACSGKKDLPLAVLKLVSHFRKLKPDVVHTHLTHANLAGLAAAKLTGVKRRFFTRHHANFVRLFHPHAVIYDRISASLATGIVAASQNVRDYLTEVESVPSAKVHLIHFGFDSAEYEKISDQRVSVLRKKYRLEAGSPVVGMISRYTSIKGTEYVLRAFQSLLDSYPHLCLVLANAKNSPYRQELQGLFDQIPAQNIREIVFEEDAPALYRLFDVFVHVPTDPVSEAFGQVYVEALLAGAPSVFTLSGVAREFIEHEKNAQVVAFKDAEGIERAIRSLLDHRASAQEMACRGRADAKSRFALAPMIEGLKRLYLAGD